MVNKKMAIQACVVVGLIIVLLVVLTICVPFDLYFGVRKSRTHWAPSSRSNRGANKQQQRQLLKKSRVPAILHQTWKSKGLIPFQANNRAKWVGCLEKHNKQFEFPLHIDSEFDAFVQAEYAWFWPTWERLTPFIKKVDAARYMWLHHYGGVYADLDLELEDDSQLIDLIDKEYPETSAIISSNSTHATFANTGPAFIVAHRGHDFFISMLHYIEAHVNKPVIHCTGPRAMSHALHTYLRNKNRRHHIVLISNSACGLGPPLPGLKRMTYHSNSGLWKQ